MAEKKKILIFSHAMEIGGAEKALLGLLDAIDQEQYDVFLFLMRHQGEWMKYIPSSIHLLDEIPAYACMAVPLKEVIRKGQLTVALGRAVGKYKAKRYIRANGIQTDNDVSLQYSHKYTVSFMPEIPGSYDAAISFLTPHYYVAEKVRAKKKIAWIHTDYSNVQMDQASQLEMWKQYDHIVSISDDCSESFIGRFPALKNRIVRIDHMMPYDLIRRMAAEKQQDMTAGKIRLLSVGRFCYAKNFESIPYLCRKLKEKGLDVRWYIIGYGDETLIRKAIADTGMEECAAILGKKINPYPYIRDCDVYIQPSRYEGKAVTVLEAQVLHKPVIITDYATARSQVEDGVDGVIVPGNIDECAEGIYAVLSDTALRERLKKNCEKKVYSNEIEIRKLYQLF